MITTEFAKLDAKISQLGFGAMRLPTDAGGKIDREKAAEMLDIAYAGGVNYYDTAHNYHNGESQEFLGEALVARYPRDSFYLATKLPVFNITAEEQVEEIFALQLERCRVEYFDFYLLHSLGKENWATAKKFGMLEKMAAHKKAGQIKRLGFSYHGDFETFKEILDSYAWEFCQIQFNYIDYEKQDAKNFYEELERRGVPCIVMEPVRGGFLSRLPEAALKIMGESDNKRSVEYALRWVAGFKNVPVILSGMSSREQVEENLKIFGESAPLSETEADMINRVRAAVLNIQSVPCTMCGYCMECPSGVNIPEVFSYYNDYMLYRDKFVFLDNYDAFGKSPRPQCTACGTCVPRCPQGIAIPERLAEVAAEREITKM